MTKIRRRHSAEFKFRVALEAAKELKTTSELAQEFEGLFDTWSDPPGGPAYEIGGQDRGLCLNADASGTTTHHVLDFEGGSLLGCFQRHPKLKFGLCCRRLLTIAGPPNVSQYIAFPSQTEVSSKTSVLCLARPRTKDGRRRRFVNRSGLVRQSSLRYTQGRLLVFRRCQTFCSRHDLSLGYWSGFSGQV